MRNWVKHVHFVGIGGSGMSGIAEVIANLGYRVSGSDIAASAVTARLSCAGIDVAIGHRASNVAHCDVVVVSSAIDQTNPEIKAAIEADTPVIPRAEMLGELMRFKQGIAVAGTHGKTTTTSLVSAILIEAGLDPTFVVGGLINSAGANAKLGEGEYLVAEADESDASFLNLMPQLAIVTNIDEDHMSTYQGDINKLLDTFVAFLQNLPFYGLAVMCEDDANIQAIRERVHKPILTYGFSDTADYRATQVNQVASRMSYIALRPNGSQVEINLAMPGEHNVLNSLAAVVIADRLGVKDIDIQSALANFEGVGRRFEFLGDYDMNGKSITVVDDYGHHPVELKATLAAAKGCWPNSRILTVFQPHRYSRTQDLFDDFVQVLSGEPNLFICDVYPAGEAPISTASSKALCQAIRQRGLTSPVLVPEVNELKSVLEPLIQDGDVVLTLGAGSIGKAVRDFCDQLRDVSQSNNQHGGGRNV